MGKFYNSRYEIPPINVFAISVLLAVMIGGISAYRVSILQHALSGGANNGLGFPIQGIFISLALLAAGSLWFASKYRELEIIHYTAADDTESAIIIDRNLNENCDADQVDLSESLHDLGSYQHQMAVIASMIAEGDLTCTVSPQSDEDHLSTALSKLIIKLRAVVDEVSTSADAVSEIGSRISDSDNLSPVNSKESAASVFELTQTAVQLKNIALRFQTAQKLEKLSVFGNAESTSELRRAA